MNMFIKTWAEMTHEERLSFSELLRQVECEKFQFGVLGHSLQIIGVHTNVINKWVNELKRPHRHYHTLRHVGQILTNYENIRGTSPEIMAAAWLHDIVYDPTRHDNEERSAEQAKVDLIGTDLDISLVQDIILATKTHASDNKICRLFNDLDLFVLSLRSEHTGIVPFYLKYASQIRSEYSFAPLSVYAEKRIEFLEFLDRRLIYQTSHFCYREDMAHANIRDEIELLKSDPKRIELPS